MIPRKLERIKKEAGVVNAAPKAIARWKSTAHRDFVRGHACIVCDATAPIEVAHVRMNGAGGMGRKPDDWLTVPLCRDCHSTQHGGEVSFWQAFGMDKLDAAIKHFIANSPRATEIRKRMDERRG